MDAGDAFNKIQGEDLSHIFWDELGQEADPQVVLRRSIDKLERRIIAENEPASPKRRATMAGGHRPEFTHRPAIRPRDRQQPRHLLRLGARIHLPRRPARA